MDELQNSQTDNFLHRSTEYLSRINSLVQEMHERIIETIHQEEGSKLTTFKENLLKTKHEFDKIQENRNEENITENIYELKKKLERECSMYFEEEMEASKMHDQLKTTLMDMNTQERELKLQIQYLNKENHNVSNKTVRLQEEYQQLQKKYEQAKKEQVVVMRNESRMETTVNSWNSQKSQQQYSAEKHMEQTKYRLKTRIETTKQYLDHLIFKENLLEANFSAYSVEEFKTEKQKIKLIEEILSKQEVKKYLYSILF